MGSVTDLSRYRLERAKEDLKTAGDNLREGSYRASVNRSYYAISMRSGRSRRWMGSTPANIPASSPISIRIM